MENSVTGFLVAALFIASVVAFVAFILRQPREQSKVRFLLRFYAFGLLFSLAWIAVYFGLTKS